MNGKYKARSLFSVMLILIMVSGISAANAQVSCGSSCMTAAQVADETNRYSQGISGSKCLFIYEAKVYEPPTGSISRGMHKSAHACGADVTGAMPNNHLQNPGRYLLPYVCAPLCGSSTCQDSDGDGFQSSSCGGNDCNDNNPSISPNAAETCNNADDNCNSQIDENLQRSQSCGVGACYKTITQTCSSGQYGPACTPNSPGTETCNNLDDDCDGQTDEGLQQSQSCGVGACARTVTQACSSGQYAPSCTLGAPVNEMCGNSIDDDCDGSADEDCACSPGQSQQCGTSIGACEPGTQTCQADGTWGSCAGQTGPSAEVCGNEVDEDCNGVNEDCATPSPDPTQPPDTGTVQEDPPAPSTEPTAPADSSNQQSAPVKCIPICEESCGQSNGCGGFCPNSDIYNPGKCGNSACIRNCSQGACGQPDNCGAYCPATDINTCGLCGNKPCCVPEICDDGLDNNCDGKIDESCGKVVSFLRMLSGSSQDGSSDELTPKKSSLETTYEVVAESGFQARITGLLAFFLSGITLIVGLYRRELIKRFSRKEIIKYHTVLGFFSLFFAIAHIFAVLVNEGWSSLISIKDAFVPSFSGPLQVSMSFGVIGLYLFIATILGGIFFIKIARAFGYKTWLAIHRGSFLFYAFIFYHALKVGTDFTNPYMIVLFSHVFILTIAYIAYKLYNGKKLRQAIGSATKRIGLRKRINIEEISTNPDHVGKRVVISGNVMQIPLHPRVKGQWCKIYDDSGSVFAILPIKAKSGKYSEIEGVVMKYNSQIYIKVERLKENEKG